MGWKAREHDPEWPLELFATDFQLVSNTRYAKWYKLITKLNWGQGLNYS